MAGQARILSKEEIRDLFSILSNRRDQVIFALGIYAGLRIGEIIALKCADVYTKSGGVRNVLKFVRLKKKNTVYSNIPVHPKLRKLLEAYYKEIKAKERKSKWLFPSVKSSTGHIERVRAHYILCSAFDRLNLEGASTHSLRRTCLTNMSRAGIPLRTIQEISGHANLGQLQAPSGGRSGGYKEGYNLFEILDIQVSTLSSVQDLILRQDRKDGAFTFEMSLPNIGLSVWRKNN